MKKKWIRILIGICVIATVFSGCKRRPDAIETPDMDILLSSSETVSEKVPLTAYPEHKDKNIKTVNGVLTVAAVSEETPGNDFVEDTEFPFTYYGNGEFGYELVPDGFERVDDVTYRKTFDEGAMTVTIDGYEKGEYTFDEWLTLITGTYQDELNFAEETKESNYAMYSFNPKDDLTNLSLVEVTDDDEYIHINIITVEGVNPNEVTDGLYPYGHFDYEPISFLEELGSVKVQSNED